MLAVALALTGLGAVEAFAWGPETQRGIATLALQLIRRNYSDSFKTKDTNYEADILRGMRDGVKVLEGTTPLNSTEEAIIAVGSEIQLLRETRQHAKGSYFAYRMGVLGALASDLVMPFGMASQASTLELRQKIERDIDLHYKGYALAPDLHQLQYIRSSPTYFKEMRMFMDNSESMVSSDYDSGEGYDGYLAQGGEKAFERAVVAVADAWFSVLRQKGDSSDVPPSKPVLTWYFVGQLEHILTEKKSFYLARNMYKYFDKVNPGIPETFDKVGDLFYAFEPDEAPLRDVQDEEQLRDLLEKAQLRGVQEWEKAFAFSGPQSVRTAKKLSKHYIILGQGCLAELDQPELDTASLRKALTCFTQAQIYDRTSREAAEYVNETKVRTKEIKGRHTLNSAILAKAQTLMIEAETNEIENNLDDAMATYTKAADLYAIVESYFVDLADISEEGVKTSKNKIRELVNKVIDQGNIAITKGDQARQNNKFDQAVEHYERVDDLLRVIPDEGSEASQKIAMIRQAERLIDQAKTEQMAWKEREESAATPAGGKTAAKGRGGKAKPRGGAPKGAPRAGGRP